MLKIKKENKKINSYSEITNSLSTNIHLSQNPNLLAILCRIYTLKILAIKNNFALSKSKFENKK